MVRQGRLGWHLSEGGGGDEVEKEKRRRREGENNTTALSWAELG
jgi:hypothetical protein